MPKMLVVDDEQDICDFVRTFFVDRGFDVRVARNGEDAISAVREERPDIILLDVKMQGMDGIAVLKHLKDIDRTLQVIMVTALDERDKMEEACRLGACEYITKPLALDELEQMVEKKVRL